MATAAEELYVDKVYNPEGSVVFALRTPAENNLYISSALFG